MYHKRYVQDTDKGENGKVKRPEFVNAAIEYIHPVIDRLTGQIDKRLTYTVFDTFMGMLHFRDRANGLLLSELGGYINGSKQGPAGTKRLSNLLRNKKWSHKDIQAELLSKVETKLAEPGKEGKRWLMHWDDSVIEKPESSKLEGLCSVHSKKGARLTRIKKGRYTPYPRIRVNGFEWSAGVLSSMEDLPMIACMEWWTTKGKYRDERCNILYRMLDESCSMIRQTQAEVWHVFDRGYANRRTLDYMIEHFDQPFIIRWKSNYKLLNEKGELKQTYRHSLGKKTTSIEKRWDPYRKEMKKVGIVYFPVRDPEFPDKQLYMVILRDKRPGIKPIYFLTSVKIDTNGMAWAIANAYMKRWDVEQVFRFGKTAMGIESPRLWFWENQLKLLMLLALVMAFLLTLLGDYLDYAWQLIDTWVPRTGKRQKKTSLPLYRLRLAVSYLINYELVPT